MRDTPWSLRFGAITICILVVICTGYPVLWTLSAALKSNAQLVANPFGLPWPPEFQSMVKVWQGGEFFGFFRNSLIISLLSVGGILPMAAMAAYVFARRRLRAVGFLFGIFIVGMMIPGQVIMIPVFRIMATLGLNNTIWSVILIHLTWMPFGIFLLRTHFLSVPVELGDAARIDGCSEYGVFGRVYLPLAAPALVTLAIFEFIWTWNDYFWPLILIRDIRWFTIQQGAQRFQARFLIDYSMRNAGLVFTFLPPLAFYLIFRKGIQKGLVQGAVKG